MSKNNETFFLILDIRSSSVGAAVISQNKEGIIITWTDRIYHYFAEQNSKEEYASFIFKALEKIINNTLSFLSKNKIPMPKEVVITYGSGWSNMSVNNSKKDFDKIKEITKQDIEKIILPETPDKNILENIDYSFKLNGYLTKNPVSQKSKLLERFNYTSTIDKKVNATILGSVKSYFPKAKIIEVTHLLNFFRALDKIFPYSNDYMLIEISGETTDIMIVRDKSIESIKNFNFGRNHLVREISTVGKMSVEESLSLFRMYENHSLGTKQTEQLDKMIMAPISTWRKEFEQILSKEGLIPANWYLIGDRDIEELFTSFINHIEIPGCKKHNTIPIHQKTLNNIYTYSKNVHPEPTMDLGIYGII